MASAQEQFDALIRDWVWPALKPLGFKKKGLTFGLRGNGVWGVINFQKSSWNTKDQVSFTINLGVRSDYIASHGSRGSGPPPSDHVIPSEIYCTWQRRIGRLLPVNRDFWWEIESDTDADLGPEIRRVVLDVAVPELRARRSDEDLLGDTHRSIEHVLLLKKYRTDAEFQRAASEFAKSCESSSYGAYWKQLLKREGWRGEGEVQ